MATQTGNPYLDSLLGYKPQKPTGVVDMLLGNVRGLPSGGLDPSVMTPGFNPSGSLPGTQPSSTQPSTGVKGTLGKLDSFINSQGGGLLMNLLAQSGYSTMPQSPFGAIGRASLANQEQQTQRKRNNLEEELLRTRIGLGGAGGESPSAVREFEFFEGLNDEEKRRFLAVKRAQQLENIPGAGFGSVNPLNNTIETITPESTIVGGLQTRAGAAETGKQEAVTQAIPAQVSARSQAEELAKLPTALTGVDSQINSIDATIAKIDELIPLTSQAGLPVTLRGSLPGSLGGEPRQLKQAAQSLKANFAFDTLAKMRAASKTGGALGQVSERELDLLINALQSIDIEGDPDVLRENLIKVRTHYDNYKTELANMKAAMLQQAGQPSSTKRRRFNPATGQLEDI